MNTMKVKHPKAKKRTAILSIFIAVCILVLTINGLYLCSKIANGSESFTTPYMEYGTDATKNASNSSDTAFEKRLDVDMVFQYPELPNGCEATSLCMALKYLGYDVTKEDVAYSYVPREDFEEVEGAYYAPNPNEKYAGDPATNLGFYCTSPPIVEGANKFLREMEAGYTSLDISDSNRTDIEKLLADGMPVLIWVTIDYSSEASYHDSFTWEIENGETYYPYSNLHCVLLTGFTDEIYYVNDPIEGKLEIEKERLMNSYNALGRNAVTFTYDK